MHAQSSKGSYVAFDVGNVPQRLGRLLCSTPAHLTSQGCSRSHAPPCRRLDVICMAHPRRVAKVASQIRRELGNMICMDPVVMNAISPESKQLGDQLSAVASISNVYLSNDLQVVKAYISIYSDKRGRVRAMENLKRLQPYVRREIGSRMQLRLTPEIRFEYDDWQEEQDLVERVLGQEEVTRIRADIERDDASAAGAGATSASPDPAVKSAATHAPDIASSGTKQGKKSPGSAAKQQALGRDSKRLSKQKDAQHEYFSEPGPFDFMFADSQDPGDAEKWKRRPVSQASTRLSTRPAATRTSIKTRSRQ